MSGSLSSPDQVGGEIDTTYHTVQRDMFTSGLAGQVGPAAYLVWSAIKFHADFDSGQAWPSLLRLAETTRQGKATILRALATLEEHHLLRIVRRGWPSSNPAHRRAHTYIARERMDVRLGPTVLCTIAVDYVPKQMRERLQAVKEGLRDPAKMPPELWAQIDIVPGPGFVWDPERKVLTRQLSIDKVPRQLPPHSPDAIAAIEGTKEVADRLRKGVKPALVLKK